MDIRPKPEQCRYWAESVGFPLREKTGFEALPIRHRNEKIGPLRWQTLELMLTTTNTDVLMGNFFGVVSQRKKEMATL